MWDGTSLVVHWLPASIAGGAGPISGQGTKIPHAPRYSQTNKNKKATKESLRRSIEVPQVDKREKGALDRGTCVGGGTVDGKRKLSLRSSEWIPVAETQLAPARTCMPCPGALFQRLFQRSTPALLGKLYDPPLCNTKVIMGSHFCTSG